MRMSNRRRSAPLAVLILSLVLVPGLSLAGQRTHTPAVEESSLSVLLDWAVRAWESLTDRSPAAEAPAGHVWGAAGCGIDPNGTCTSGGGGTTSTSGGH